MHTVFREFLRNKEKCIFMCQIRLTAGSWRVNTLKPPSPPAANPFLTEYFLHLVYFALSFLESI
jgi:hypothetical protein